jgi:elongation factor 1-gamma
LLNRRRWHLNPLRKKKKKNRRQNPRNQKRRKHLKKQNQKKKNQKKKKKKPKDEKPKEPEKEKEKPKKEEKPKGDNKKKDEKPKEEKPKEGEKPKKEGKKDEKPKEKAAPKEKAPPKEKAAPKEKATEEPEDDGEEKPKKKEKNPLDLLPESKMSLDAVKKLFFSEKPFNPSFFASFWSIFDPQGYSIYTITYKYDDENKILFMTGNAVGGFIQRAEEVRKYAFGTLSIIGKDEDTPPYKIVGSWIFRGADIPKEMQECDDYSYYNWTKVDSTKPDVRKRIEALFTAESLGAAENVIDRRYFK